MEDYFAFSWIEAELDICLRSSQTLRLFAQPTYAFQPESRVCILAPVSTSLFMSVYP